MFKHILLPTLAFALALAGSGAQAAEPQLADIIRDRQQMNLAFDQLLECKRRAPGLAYAGMAGLWQIDDFVKLRFGEPGTKAVEQAANLPAPACDSPPDQQLKLVSHRLGFEWLTRLAVARAVSLQGGWSAGIAEVPPFPAELEGLRKQLGANLATVNGPQAVEALALQYQRETETELALLCEERKTERTKAPRACPALPAELLQHRPLAAARIANLELMAARMAEVDTVRNTSVNPLGEPFGFYISTDFARWITRYSVPCTPNQAVVYLTDPAASRSTAGLVLPQRAFGSGEVTGQVTVKPDNANYASKLEIVAGVTATAPLSPFQTEMEFVRCPNQLP